MSVHHSLTEQQARRRGHDGQSHTGAGFFAEICRRLFGRFGSVAQLALAEAGLRFGTHGLGGLAADRHCSRCSAHASNSGCNKNFIFDHGTEKDLLRPSIGFLW